MFRPSKSKCACGNDKSQVAQRCLRCARAGNKVTGTCSVCGRTFAAKLSKRQQTCSVQCAYVLRGRRSGDTQSRRVAFVCRQCGTEREVSPSRNRGGFCSTRCAYDFNTGSNNPRWKGNATATQRAFFRSTEWTKHCAVIWKRDRRTCRRCSRRHQDGERAFHVHHVGSWLKFPELRLDAGNTLLLCRPCHRFVHSRDNVGRDFIRLRSSDL